MLIDNNAQQHLPITRLYRHMALQEDGTRGRERSVGGGSLITLSLIYIPQCTYN